MRSLCYAVLMSSLWFAGCAGTDDSEFVANEPDPSTEVQDTGDEVGWPVGWEAFEDEVLRIVNVKRSALQRCGGESMGFGAPLVFNAQLRDAARAHSEDMAVRDFFAHRAPGGSEPSDRAQAAGYTGPVGENIAYNAQTPEEVMEGWMNSPGHCRNIMDTSYVSLGVGLYVNEAGETWWTQVFGQL